MSKQTNYPKDRQPASTPRTGRPAKLKGGQRRSIFLSEEQRAWCNRLEGVSASEYIRELIDADKAL